MNNTTNASDIAAALAAALASSGHVVVPSPQGEALVDAVSAGTAGAKADISDSKEVGGKEGLATSTEGASVGASPSPEGEVVAEVLTPPADLLAAKKALRASLLDKVKACTDSDQLEALTSELDRATRAGEYMLLREEVVQAFKAKHKGLTGVTLKVAQLETLFPKPAAKKSATLAALPLTEFGVTERFKAAHGHELLFAVDADRWYRYAEGYWQQEPSSVRVVQMAREVIKKLRPEAESIIDPEAMTEALQAVAACERTNFAAGVVAGLAGEEGVASSSLEMDTTPHLLCVKNGIVDLRTGELLPHDPEARLTMVTACDYVPGAPRPWFERTLKDALKDDERIAFLKRFMGYAILGQPKERAMLVPIGKGKNGKSTIFNAIQEVLGTHAATMNSNVIATPAGAVVNGNSGGPAEQMLRLRGKRGIFASETKRGAVFNDDTVKTLASGGDTIVARGINAKNSIEFRPTGVVILPANVLATVRDDDAAVYDRLVVLRFSARFDQDAKTEPDTQRPQKLKDEMEGILAWLVEGALEYQADGLQIPESVHQAKQSQREGSSLAQQFVEDCCELGSTHGATVKELFNAWQAYAFEHGETKLAQTSPVFSKYMCANVGVEPGDKRVSFEGEQHRVLVGVRLQGSRFKLPADYFQQKAF